MATDWQTWRQTWEEAAARLTARGFTVNDLRVDPPATDEEIARVEGVLGRALPRPLRDVFREHASAVHFGWSLPAQGRRRVDGPTSGGLRGLVFGLAHMVERAIPNFASWRAELADRDDGEQPNSPSMWENQIPIAELVNGDMLTIDGSSKSEQPVRYFSHELEGLHGRIIAPDWPSFVTEYSKLGCAGVEHSDWFRFCGDGEEDELSTRGFDPRVINRTQCAAHGRS